MIASGAGSFAFAVRRDGGTAPLTVWTWRPARFGPDDPILFVLHGAARNGRAYRDAWAAHAERRGALLLAPEFSRAAFPTAREYEVGNMRDRERRPLPPDQWSFAAIERLFDLARAAVGSRRERYGIFGHSAGAQFVHRLLTFLPDCRAGIAVAANAGCYTMPAADERFPYGLGGMPLDAAALARLLRRNLILLLGERDDDPESRLLLKTPEAMRQGAHRLARGRAYYRQGADAARRLGVPFGWRLVPVPDVGHCQRGMADAAAALIFARDGAPPCGC